MRRSVLLGLVLLAALAVLGGLVARSRTVEVAWLRRVLREPSPVRTSRHSDACARLAALGAREAVPEIRQEVERGGEVEVLGEVEWDGPSPEALRALARLGGAAEAPTIAGALRAAAGAAPGQGSAHLHAALVAEALDVLATLDARAAAAEIPRVLDHFRRYDPASRETPFFGDLLRRDQVRAYTLGERLAAEGHLPRERLVELRGAWLELVRVDLRLAKPHDPASSRNESCDVEISDLGDIPVAVAVTGTATLLLDGKPRPAHGLGPYGGEVRRPGATNPHHRSLTFECDRECPAAAARAGAASHAAVEVGLAIADGGGGLALRRARSPDVPADRPAFDPASVATPRRR